MPDPDPQHCIEHRCSTVFFGMLMAMLVQTDFDCELVCACQAAKAAGEDTAERLAAGHAPAQLADTLQALEQYNQITVIKKIISSAILRSW